MDWIGLIFTLAGSLIFAMFGAQIVLVLKFAIPLSIKLSRNGFSLNTKMLIFTDILTLCFSFFILGATTGIVIWLFPDYPIYFLIGMGIVFIILLFERHKKPANTEEYLKTHQQFLYHEEEMKQFLLDQGYLWYVSDYFFNKPMRNKRKGQ